jgi:hypothetical protein
MSRHLSSLSVVVSIAAILGIATLAAAQGEIRPANGPGRNSQNAAGNDFTAADVFLILTVLVFSTAMYLLPIIIAAFRSHPNVASIVAVNILLGWTLIGYVVALAWSLSAFNYRPPPRSP